jgi:CBS domain-containing protein
MSNDNDDIDDIDVPAFGPGSASISTVIGDEPVVIASTATLRDAARRLSEAGVGMIVVGSTEVVEGVVSERDIVRAVATGVDLDTTTVADVETKDHLDWATVDSTIAEVADEMMRDYGLHRKWFAARPRARREIRCGSSSPPAPAPRRRTRLRPTTADPGSPWRATRRRGWLPRQSDRPARQSSAASHRARNLRL